MFLLKFKKNGIWQNLGIKCFMDKQKSYGENYQQTKLKHRFSLRFVLITIFCCVLTVALVATLVGVLL